jgi:ribA/ribD-fused uncharacterized protein
MAQEGKEEESILSSLSSAISSATESIIEATSQEEKTPSKEDIEAAPVAVAVAKAPRAPRGPKVSRPPKDATTFFRALSKEPKKYGFSPSGDMATFTSTGSVDTTLPLPKYRVTTPEERRTYELGIKEEIRSVEKDYDESLKNLKVALVNWKATGISSEAVELQRKLIGLDAKRTSLRSPLRWITSYRNVERSLLFPRTKQPDLKIGHPVYSLQIQPIPFNQQVVEDTGSSAPPEQKKEVKEAPLQESFVVFSIPAEETYGVLSPETPMDLTYSGTRYNSVLQAYHAERVGQLGNKGLRISILKATNPKTIRFMGDSVKGTIENPSSRELLINIVQEALKQDARITTALKASGKDSLVYADPKDIVLGIGIPADKTEEVMQRSTWRGQNLLGQAWEVVRSSMKDDGVFSGGAVLEKARTLEDVKKERSSVIMGYYRKGRAMA